MRVDSKLPAEAGRWYHLAAVYDRYNSQISLYVNGSLQGTDLYDAAWQAVGPTIVGAAYAPSAPAQRTDRVAGRIDDVLLDDAVLTPTQIATLARRRGLWTMNDAAGPMTPDISGAGNPLTLVGGATLAPGKYATSLTLNGTDAYAQAATGIVDTRQSFTATAWVKLNATGGWQTFVSQAGTNVNKFWLQKRADNGRFSFVLSDADADGSGQARVDSAAVAEANRWYHLAGVYDATAGVVKLYVDSVLQGTTPHTSTWDATGPTLVGAARGGSPAGRVDVVNGQIDHVNLVAGVMSAAELS